MYLEPTQEHVPRMHTEGEQGKERVLFCSCYYLKQMTPNGPIPSRQPPAFALLPLLGPPHVTAGSLQTLGPSLDL